MSQKPSNLTTIEADLDDPTDASAIVGMLDAYARDRFGGSKPLTDSTKERLIPALRQHPTSLVLLAFNDKEPVGMATCFVGFSTFQAQPLLNIHDLVVAPNHRGCGIGRALLEFAQQAATRRGCCKLTLEVVQDNALARGLYEKFGFANQGLGDSKVTHFLQKQINTPA